MVPKSSVFDEIFIFIAEMNPEKVADFKPSEAHQQRLDWLLAKQKGTPFSPEEKSEIEQCLMLNRLVGLAKARALQMLHS